MINEENIRKIKFHYENKIVTGNFLPAVFVLEPISICDLNCVMCPNSELTNEQLGFMNVDDFDTITKIISPFAELVMLYFMGEPLLHPQFESIISLARKNIKGKIVLSTNCMQLNESAAKIIVSNNIDLVICCLDHWTKEKYEKIRVGGKFEQVINNIKGLLNTRGTGKFPTVVVKSLDFGFSEIEEREYSNFWKELGARPLIGWVDSWAGQLNGLEKLTYKIPPNYDTKRVACADLWFKMVINWQGVVVLCCHNYNYSLVIGSVKDGLLETWQSKRIQHLRYFHINDIFSCNKICKNCKEWGTIKELDVYTNFDNEDIYLVF